MDLKGGTEGIVFWWKIDGIAICIAICIAYCVLVNFT